ncbi:hypothetical protein CR513_16330, partial [Mucuna pruriens]
MNKATKDVEQFFNLISQLYMHVNTFKHVLYACIILYNMIVEDKQYAYDN